MCTLSGDPHYTSFDTAKFSYQGTCKYNLASVCAREDNTTYFEVFARSENRNGDNQVAYARYVEVIFNEDTVKLAKSDVATVVTVTVLVRNYSVS
jgi:hypothetical protein